MKQKVKGGLADKHSIASLAKKHKVKREVIIDQLKKGIKVEFEHTKNPDVALEIAMDHVFEDLKYYDKLKSIEKH